MKTVKVSDVVAFIYDECSGPEFDHIEADRVAGAIQEKFAPDEEPPHEAIRHALARHGHVYEPRPTARVFVEAEIDLGWGLTTTSGKRQEATGG